MSKKHTALPESPLLGRGRGEAALSRASHLSPHTVQHLLDTLADEVAQALARGESYTIPGIGAISCRELRERTTSNLREGNKSTTQGSIAIPARRKITFRADLALVRKANAKNTEGKLPIVR